ncbi:hypothetical protein [Novosphingobium sp. AP12]|nr:hypothetical protein [Novosphingobium sp. AP12]
MTSMRIAPLAATIWLSAAVFSIADPAVGKMTGVTIGKEAH